MNSQADGSKVLINTYRCRQMAAKMVIKSATIEENLQIVTNSHTDGSKDGHKVSNY